MIVVTLVYVVRAEENWAIESGIDQTIVEVELAPLDLRHRANLMARQRARQFASDKLSKLAGLRGGAGTRFTTAPSDGRVDYLAATLAEAPYDELRAAFATDPVAGNRELQAYVERSQRRVHNRRKHAELPPTSGFGWSDGGQSEARRRILATIHTA